MEERRGSKENTGLGSAIYRDKRKKDDEEQRTTARTGIWKGFGFCYSLKKENFPSLGWKKTSE